MMKWIKEVKNELNNQKDQYLLRKERGRHSEVPAESERACASVLCRGLQERWALSELGSEEGVAGIISHLPVGWPRKIHRSWVTAGLGSE